MWGDRPRQVVVFRFGYNPQIAHFTDSVDFIDDILMKSVAFSGFAYIGLGDNSEIHIQYR